MQVRILHITNENPYVSSNILIDYFGCQNQALQKIEKFIINNALPLIENVGWVVSKVIEHDSAVSVLFIKREYENEEYIETFEDNNNS